MNYDISINCRLPTKNCLLNSGASHCLLETEKLPTGNSPLLIVILGPTGVGKTDFSLSLARKLSTVIVSADARQVYREMKIGTAPPDAQQLAEVPHYFIGSHSIREHYTAGQYELDALALLEKLFVSHPVALLTGGSGLYIDAVCYGIDNFPETDLPLRAELSKRLQTEGIESLRWQLKQLDETSYRSIDLKNPQRIIRALEICLSTGKPYSEWKTGVRKKRPFEIVKIGLQRPRGELYARINARTLQMMDNGLLEEARKLYPCKDLPALKTVGYTELFDYLDGKTTLEKAIQLIQQHTRNYAKRQLSYWSRYDDIQWQEM
ncbi:MAG: tRNA (adenosine(37)-N6)-dimethylallyltransferase MiaA [Prevotellaceae bacterium]|jgi:tRNA dimethylallyltransferase|nr:tRNA (adenosine(37)-N6)-dimethylallyltransferase MiaA [Prevotellaceae bacterium]